VVAMIVICVIILPFQQYSSRALVCRVYVGFRSAVVISDVII
jgi:hypothetical protein